MEVHPEERRIRLSARAFAEFASPGAVGTPPRSLTWRASIGQVWHQHLRQQALEREEPSEHEIKVAASIPHRGWTFDLEGRIDQIIHDGPGHLLREIKTVATPLPTSEAYLIDAYPQHFLQLACYLIIIQARPVANLSGNLRGEVVFVDYRAGVIQPVALPGDSDSTWCEQADRIVAAATELRARRQRMRSLQIGPAFAETRPEQRRALLQLDTALASKPRVAFEAPTGFGKTGVALESALKLLAGPVQHVLFLSGKSSGQHQAVRQLKHFARNAEGVLHFFQLRSKREHQERCPITQCDGRLSCHENLAEHWREANLSPQCQLNEGTISLDGILELSAQSGICPHALSRRLLAESEVWVCDYNYVFSPRHAAMLENIFGFKPERSLLIVDEAHNLPARVAENFSFVANAYEADRLAAELSAVRAGPALLAAWQNWTEFLQSLQPNEQHEARTEYETTDHLQRIVQHLRQTPVDWDALDPALVDRLFACEWQLDALQDERFQHLFWSRSPAELRVECLDATAHIRQQLSHYHRTLLMSATLQPMADFWDEVGGRDDGCCEVLAGAPWREHAYRVAIDARVDTRLRRRADYYLTTAETVARLAQDGPAPVAVFFPSYQYAETIRAYLQAEHTQLIVALQPRAIELSGQLRFIEESLLTAHALFFVLGSSFSESVDYLGGRIETALVVGPALPEVNAAQKARQTASAHLGREAAFEHVYIRPAMRKINQALGRLVRAPGQQARVLLHCRRFSEAAYRQRLDKDFTPGATIRADDELEAWLRGVDPHSPIPQGHFD